MNRDIIIPSQTKCRNVATCSPVSFLGSGPSEIPRWPNPSLISEENAIPGENSAYKLLDVAYQLVLEDKFWWKSRRGENYPKTRQIHL